MSPLGSSQRRRLHLAAERRALPVLLAALLQVMPMLRTILPLQSQLLASPAWAFVLRVAGTATALLGSYHAVSGATAIVAPYTVNAQVGSPYSRQLTTSGQTAHSWSANTAPLGTAVFPLTPGLWLTNSNGRIGGIPTVAITTNITISAWENGGNSGASISAVFTFTITNGTGAGTAPTIATQPQSQTNDVGSTANFTVLASGSAPLSYQWRLNGVPITGATASNYARLNLQTNDAGNYSVVVTNLAGSATSSNAVLIVLSSSADIAAACSGPSSVAPGASLNYAITITNLGPSVASNVVVQDVLPPAATFVSATGGGVNSSGVVTWPAITSLASGGATSFTVTVTAPGSGTLTNIVSSSSSVFDPVAANNDGSSAAARVITVIGASADLIVFKTGPPIVLAGSNLTYTLSVTNLGPSAATNILVSDFLPANVVYVNASGSGSLSNGVVRWPVISSLPNGGAAGYTVTVTAPASGSFTNSASATSITPDPNPANNNGSSTNSQAATVVATAQGQFGIAAGAIALNPQTGLYEQSVVVANNGAVTAAAVRLYADGLRSGVQLYNASGSNGDTPYAQYNLPLNPNQTVTFLLEFYVPDRGPFTDSFQAAAVMPGASVQATGGFAISREFVDTRISGSPRFVIEFATVPGQAYTVIYSDDGMATWQVATPSIVAGATVTQWYDDGPPETLSKPLSAGSRFYRVIAGPASP